MATSAFKEFMTLKILKVLQVEATVQRFAKEQVLWKHL